MPETRRNSIRDFQKCKEDGRKISMLTAYDFWSATILDEAGIDGILVGDSMGMVIQGKDTTIPVTLDQIIYHAEIVVRASRRALVVADMPFPTYLVGKHKAIENAGRLLKETGCQAVKLEGGEEQAETIEALVRAGIPVMGHVGLRPQSVHQTGGYRVQRDLEVLLRDAQAAESAGAFSIVMECLPVSIAEQISETIKIPTIGIGAGPGCDGQILVLQDMLGLTHGYVPRFVKPFADLKQNMSDAITAYRNAVEDCSFPAEEHSYKG